MAYGKDRVRVGRTTIHIDIVNCGLQRQVRPFPTNIVIYSYEVLRFEHWTVPRWSPPPQIASPRTLMGEQRRRCCCCCCFSEWMLENTRAARVGKMVLEKGRVGQPPDTVQCIIPGSAIDQLAHIWIIILHYYYYTAFSHTTHDYTNEVQYKTSALVYYYSLF